MSLLNQVLQDLEKRNAENRPEQQYQSNVRVITPGRSNSYLSLISFLIVITILVVIAIGHKKNDISSSQSIQLTLPAPKQKINTTKISQQFIQTRQQPGMTHPVIPEKPNNTKQTEQTLLKVSVAKNQSAQPVSSASTAYKTLTIESKENQYPVLPSAEPLIVTKPVVKKLSSKQKAEQLFVKAKQQKNSHLRQKSLQRALILNPFHMSARLLFANTLLNQGLPYKAAETLDLGLQLLPQNLPFINLRSQLLLQKKQTQDALTTLQRIDHSYVRDETYLSLLAAAFEQNNENLKSLKIYQRLIKINPGKAEYWLGIAIAQEKKGNMESAVKAYQQALNKNTLKTTIVNYIKHRLNVLD